MTVLQLPVEEQLRLLMRGVEYGDPHLHAAMEEELRQRLQEGRPLRVYCGFDPTAPDLHLGSLVPMLKMRQFQRLGHEVTFLIGTMTGIVGDPSDKTAARRMLTPEEIEANAETWLGQAFRVLDPKLTLVRRNGDWLRDLTLNDVVQLASHFTVSQFLDRESFQQRLEAGKPIYVHEFLYALMQGYDAVAMNTDVQIGGTDQLFNILAGRILQRAHGQRPQVAVCTPILVGTDGHLKMSKSVGNYIGLDEPPSEMYGKVMSIPDSLIGAYFTLLTEVPEEDVAALRRDLDSRSANPMDAKKRLAREVVALLNGEAAARAAQAEFERVYQRREAPAESAVEVSWRHLPFAGSSQVSAPPGIGEPVDVNTLPMNMAEFIARYAQVSVSEARRLIRQGAVSVDGTAIREAVVGVSKGSVVRVGRHRFFRIVDEGE